MENQQIFESAISMYVGEPCRICGFPLSRADLETAVFAGYSLDGESRTAHKSCYQKLPATKEGNPNPRWKHQ